MTTTSTVPFGRALLGAAVALVLVAGACSDGDDAAPVASSTVVTAGETGTDDGESEGDVERSAEESAVVDNLARFVAAAESALDGSDAAGDVLDAPEIYIAIAQSACARFSAGEAFDVVATDLLEGDNAIGGDDSERLVGAVLGAGIETLCPEHADLL